MKIVGVYYFKVVSSTKVRVNVIIACEIWHELLGHPSKRILSLLPKNLGVSGSFDNNKGIDVCDICFHIKQTRC